MHDFRDSCARISPVSRTAGQRNIVAIPSLCTSLLVASKRTILCSRDPSALATTWILHDDDFVEIRNVLLSRKVARIMRTLRISGAVDATAASRARVTRGWLTARVAGPSCAFESIIQCAGLCSAEGESVACFQV